MFNRLRSRLILFMVGVTIFSIVLVSAITNITLFRKFDVYMKDEQAYKVTELVRFIEDTYEQDNQWSEAVIEKIQSNPAVGDVDIKIMDANNEIIFVHSIESDMWNMHQQMMERMGHSVFGGMGQGMMRHSMDGGDYQEELYEVKVDSKIIGSVEIGYAKPLMISEREVEFTRGINKSIIYASIFAIFIAILLGQYFSKIISRPILNITAASNHIRNGKLGTRITDKNNITELKELSNAINHLAISLEEQHSLRKRLTADISHELRTPLTILHGQIEAISDGVWEPTKERMNIFKNEVARLMTLVEQLKDLTEIETTDIALEMVQFNLSQLIYDVVENFKYQCMSKNIEVNYEIEENIFIYADKHRMSQILINLLSNALKFTTPEGQVTVKAHKNRGKVLLEVADTGIGISQEDISHIFERLYRGERSRSRKTGGAGIGLTITKKLVEAHQGSIRVESEEGKGSRFIVTLPQANE
ncbi:signal transduction histidine kinase [Anaerosolibacter carboniphilus]|uniref:histidine kinase n=1 Tax=Anaerosolibacter carboniphilus TaxID=1417629 RepID=A0A841KPP4_9FIRM|nr:HAMP domain-containing sensor histidine kinase [Anaerosolibacter carboniphilus]MBB6215436.1 signal transduction histidine kinase [Anaerosolibacter carboniphilus]